MYLEQTKTISTLKRFGTDHPLLSNFQTKIPALQKLLKENRAKGVMGETTSFPGSLPWLGAGQRPWERG